MSTTQLENSAMFTDIDRFSFRTANDNLEAGLELSL